ncbi:DEAD/DEAH box helicase [Roseicyclus marinus]|uniref:DEAD/DEAH box helicase n=1 Tax=Roseicyclus marinus TaxID=2161673 RepID=UPI002410AEF9|nr:DEAD/DEAH box helicase [Roseicyclus marinus]MDG3043126.1 DEAD/DEAH box helicase [Roseicyclus marinus]
MDSRLRQLMAELESWESAVEFGISEDLWAEYQVRLKSDDVYIAALTEMFDVLREQDEAVKKADLSELAKTLMIYSRSAAAKYLSGVERNVNLLYSASLFYLADFPATASLVAKAIDPSALYEDEEFFLWGLLSRQILDDRPLHDMLATVLRGGTEEDYERSSKDLYAAERQALNDNPSRFIASRLALSCLLRFKRYSTWNNLRQYASLFEPRIWQQFIENSDTFPLWELFPSQIEAMERGILGDINEVYSLQMPTSAGKTSLCELIIYHEVKARNKRVLFLVPFRALAAEIKEGISRRLEQVGVSVVASYGGNISTRSESASAETADVLIVTPEKFIALGQSIPDLENRFETIICDEGHLIDDDGRGLQYELLLTKLKGRDPGSKKIIFISAILPNVPSIHSWLGGRDDRLAVSSYKPVETDFAFVGKRGNTWQLDFNTIYQRPRSYFLARFLTDDDFRYTNPETGRQKLLPSRGTYSSLACAAALRARRNGPVALFTTTKGNQGVAGLTKTLISMISLPVNVAIGTVDLTPELKLLEEFSAFHLGKDHQLTHALRFGIGFHHGDLPQEIRREVEEAVHANIITILICTSTLAEGVNLPIRTLVVHTIKRYDGNATREINRRSIKNIVGRVGRAGKETRGRIIFANEGEKLWVESVFREQALEPARGALYNLITSLNRIVVDNNITLNNQLFEAQSAPFLIILDRIDSAIVDLMPADFIIDDVEHFIGDLIGRTLAFQYLDTEALRDRIKEVFAIRARALIEGGTPDTLARLRRSGSTPRFQRFVEGTNILDRPEWKNLESALDDAWLDGVVLPLMAAPTFPEGTDLSWVRQLILFWMSGQTYHQMAAASGRSVDDCLEGLTSTIGFILQDAIAKATQLAILEHGEGEISELAANWASMLQYGVCNLQQLDLFWLGASDRLAVWSLSRYIEINRPYIRGQDILAFLRESAPAVITHLRQDSQVPTLSANRVIRELRLEY